MDQELLKYFEDTPSLAPASVSTPIIEPEPIVRKTELPPITQAFGNRNEIERFSGGINYGVDFGVPVSTPVALPEGNWKVIESYNQAQDGWLGNSTNSGYGNSVLAQNLDTGEKIRLSHLSQVDVAPNQELKGGLIGMSGATGNVTGPHLDVEYYDASGQPADITQTPYTEALFNPAPAPVNPTPLPAISVPTQNQIDPELLKYFQ